MVKWKKLLKKPLCMVLCSAMVVTSGNFTVPGLAGTVKAAEGAAESINLIGNPSFDYVENDKAGWWYGDDGGVQDGQGHDTGKYIKISSASTSASLGENIKAYLESQNTGIENNTEYEFSFWVKADKSSRDVEVKAELLVEKNGGYPSASDSGWTFNSTEVTVSDEWQEVTGSFITNYTEGQDGKPDFDGLHFKITGTSTKAVSFYADDVSLVKKEVAEEPGGTVPSGSDNILSNPSFDDLNNDGKISWWYGDGVDGSQDDGNGHDNGKYVKISKKGTKATLAESIPDIKNKIENNTEYEFIFWVKADENSQDVKVKAELSVEKDGSYPSASDSGWTFNSTEVTVSDEWQKVTGSFTTNYTEGQDGKPDFDGLHFKITGTSTGTVSFYADDVSVTKKKATDEEPGGNIPEKGTNILDNPSFDCNTDGWFVTTANEAAKLKYVPEGGQDDIGGCVKVYDRNENWNSLAQDIKNKVKNKTKYNFSCWVKLGDEYSAESTVKAGLTINSTGDNEGKDIYDGWGISNNTVKASKDEWRQIKGSFMANWNGTLSQLQFKVADENNTNSFYVDNLSITENEVDLSIEQDIPSLKDYFASVNPKHDFKVGTALTADILSNDNKMQLVKKHYNSVTAGNEMKPDYIIKGLNEDGSLKLDFSIPDAMLDAFWEHNQGKAEKDQIHVRGHVLCWHSQTPDFFFKDTEGNLLSKDAMNARIEEYIKKVLEHVNEKYPGLIYCWDVVNEAIIPSDGEKGGLRVYAGGRETFYHQIYKDSNEYIINAFTYADKYAEEGVKLFYNDYGETEPTKVKCISGLADAIKAGGGRIDGIGMQSHYSMESPGAEEFYNAITEYGKHVDEVQITELDMLASKSYDGSDAQKEAELVKQAYRYKEFVDTILKAKDDGTNITALVFWGVADDDSWLISPEFSDGRHNMPLLFDENLKAKPAYWAIVDPSKLAPNINEADVLESSKDWSLASPVNIGTDGKASMKLLWNDGKLFVQVTVKDGTSDAGDKVTIYLDKENSKSENTDGVGKVIINRSEAKATTEGYVAEAELAVAGKAANAKLGLDVVVYDAAAGTSQCWNDFQMKQDERSKYYGTITLKPFMVITKGSAIIDGEAESVWNDITPHKLTVNSNLSGSAKGNVKAMWDENYLYVLANIQDEVLNNDNPDAWEQDSFEIFVDENNGKTANYEEDDCQYRISYKNDLSFNGKNCNADNIQSAVKETADGYIVEAKIKFNKVKGAENNLIGVDFQINDADASGRRVATINWYDASGMGYAQPAVFGTAKLAAGASVPTKKPGQVVIPPYAVYTPVPESTPAQSAAPEGTAAPAESAAPGSSAQPGGTQAPAESAAPEGTAAPGTTTEITKDDVTGAIKETTTTVEGNKTTVIEKVTLPGNIQNIKETVTENIDGLIKTTEKYSSSVVNAVMVTNKTSKTDGTIVESDSVIYTGVSDINSNYSAKVNIPESFLLNAKEAAVKNIGIYIEKPTVDAVIANQGRKMVVKVAVPDVDGVSVGKVVVTKESISSALNGSRKLVVKIENARPEESFTVTIPQSELKKMKSDIDITVKTKKVPDADSSIKENIENILSANGVKTGNSYIVSVAGNNTKGGIKVSSPVLAPSVKTGDSVYVYCYNNKTGKLEEIANSKRVVLDDGMAGIECYPGNNYVVTDKELSGKNVVTLIGSTKVSVKKASVKKGSSTKVDVKLPSQLVVKASLKKSVPYGKQAAVVTFKSSDNSIAKVSKDGTVKAKGKGKAVITVKVKLADGKTKTFKKKVTIK